MKNTLTYTLLLVGLGFTAQAQEVNFEAPQKIAQVNSEAEETQPILSPG